MNGFNFGMRQSGDGLAADNYYGRKNVASSIYSGGPGPAEEMPHSTSTYGQEPLRNPFQLDQPRYNPLNQEHPRSSALLNVNDPVTMHLLMETAMLDSKEYEILSFEEGREAQEGELAPGYTDRRSSKKTCIGEQIARRGAILE